MKTLISASVFAAAIIVGSSAYAADMAVKAPAPAPYVPYNWTGVYGGLEAGWGESSSTQTVITNEGASFPPGYVESPVDVHGVLGGLYGGYNYQINQFVVGIDGDYTWASLSGTQTDVSPFDSHLGLHTDRMNSVATATGRLGYAWDKWLFFAKGGWAWANFDGSSTSVSPTGAVTGLSTTQNDRNGWTVGGGFEFGVTEHVSFKVEYDYVKFNTAYYNVTENDFNPFVYGQFARSATSNLNMVKGGLAWRY